MSPNARVVSHQIAFPGATRFLRRWSLVEMITLHAIDIYHIGETLGNANRIDAKDVTGRRRAKRLGCVSQKN